MRRVDQTLLNQLEQDLDIRNIMQTRLDLRLLIGKILTKEQRLLFKNQRARLPTPYSDRNSASSSQQDIDAPIALSKRKIQKFADQLQGFVPQNEIDIKLLKGLFLRHQDPKPYKSD